MARVVERSLTVRSGDVELAGSLWQPAGDVAATLLMHPGSGPSTRDNDVDVPPIRQHLGAAGIAVASFDKRGVGGSSGHWTEAGIVEQAADATAALSTSSRRVWPARSPCSGTARAGGSCSRPGRAERRRTW